MASPGGALAACAPPSPPFDSRAALGEAVAALYTSPDPRARAAADAWLQQFLRSDHAWPLSLRMLRDGEDLTSIEALFCARALHVLLRKSVVKAERTQRSHAVLDADDWTGAREALLRLMWAHADAIERSDASADAAAPPTSAAGTFAARAKADAAASRAVLTQVALALAALACKMDAWDPASIVPDVLRYFSSSSSGGDGGGRAPSSGAACFLHVLAVLPEECASKDLSVHPARREAVRRGLRDAAATSAFPAMDAISRGASVGSARVLAFRAFAAWSAFAPDCDAAAPSATLEFALEALLRGGFVPAATPGGIADRLLDAAQAAVASALVEATHRPSRRDALAAALAAIREAIRESPGPRVGFEYDEHSDEYSRLHRLTQILASVAVRASEPAPVARAQAEAVKDPLAVGPAAAGDRAYVPYKQFAEMRKEAKRSGRGKSRGADANDADGVLDPLEGADGDALAFCLDALAEAMATGAASPATAFEAWTSVAGAMESRGVFPDASSSPRHPASNPAVAAFLPTLRLSAARIAESASWCASRWLPASGVAAANDARRGAIEDAAIDDDPFAPRGDGESSGGGAFDETLNRRGEDRETLSEGLRDVARCVGADAFVACVVDRFRDRVEALYATAEERAVAACEGWLFSLFAVARLTSDSRTPESVEATVAGVTAARAFAVHERCTPRGAELVAWTVAGFCHKALPTCGDPAAVGRALETVAALLKSADAAVSRGACVAAMRACEFFAKRDLREGGAQTVVRIPLPGAFRDAVAQCYASGGPSSSPPLSALRRGQEPATTILARALAATAVEAAEAGELCDASCARLAAAAAEAEAAADAFGRGGGGGAAADASLVARRRVYEAGLRLAAAAQETEVAARAVLVADARRSGAEGTLLGADREGNASSLRLASAYPSALALALRAADALAEALVEKEASRQSSGFHTGVSGVLSGPARGAVRRVLLAADDTVAAASTGLAAVVKAAGAAEEVGGSRAALSAAPAALELALGRFARNPARHARLHAVLVAGLGAESAAVRAFACEASKTAMDNAAAALERIDERTGERRGEARGGEARGFSSSDARSTLVRAFVALTHASLRVGSPALVPSAASVVAVSITLLRDPGSARSGDPECSLDALALAADALACAAALAPARHAAGRSPEHAAAAGTVAPGMGRLASVVSTRSGRGSHLPRWRAGDAGAVALADAMGEATALRAGGAAGGAAGGEGCSDATLFTDDGGGGAAIVRALLECANGAMPPSAVTDVAAAMFAAWTAVGDEVFGGWLTRALGGDRDGFPRANCTREQKAEFAAALLGVDGFEGGGGWGKERGKKPSASGRGPVKVDLRRFKRVLKAFCGGKKSASASE